jgi:hypothetical protein
MTGFQVPATQTQNVLGVPLIVGHVLEKRLPFWFPQELPGTELPAPQVAISGEPLVLVTKRE